MSPPAGEGEHVGIILSHILSGNEVLCVKGAKKAPLPIGGQKREFLGQPVGRGWGGVLFHGTVWQSFFTRQTLDRSFGSKQEVTQVAAKWESEQQKKINWPFTTKHTRIKIARLYPTI